MVGLYNLKAKNHREKKIYSAERKKKTNQYYRTISVKTTTRKKKRCFLSIIAKARDLSFLVNKKRKISKLSQSEWQTQEVPPNLGLGLRAEDESEKSSRIEVPLRKQL